MDELKVATSMPDKQQLIYMIYFKKKWLNMMKVLNKTTMQLLKKKDNKKMQTSQS